MAIFMTDNPWVLTFGVLGNIISIVVFLAPVPTFCRACRKKSTEGFESVPYGAALFSAMLWLYYASLKTESDAFLLIKVNSVGCVIETIYIALYLAYAPKQARMLTLRPLIVLNLGGYCSFHLLSHFLAKGWTRVQLLGWICVALSIAVFTAPLSVIVIYYNRMVIRTKSVEHAHLFIVLPHAQHCDMAPIWPIPQGLVCRGVIFGVLQMALHAIYRKGKMIVMEEEKNDTSIGKLSSDLQSCNAHAIASPIGTIVFDEDREAGEKLHRLY